MNINGEDPGELGGLGDVLPAELLKKLNVLLEQLHHAEHPHHGSNIINIYASGSQHVDTIQTQNIYTEKRQEAVRANNPDEVAADKIMEAVAAVVSVGRANGSARIMNWWFCIYAPMAELNEQDNSISCFWDSQAKGMYKSFFRLMHQWFDDDTALFDDDSWTASLSSEKKKWVRAGLLNRRDGKRMLTPHECWGDYATRHQGRWTEAQAKKARTAYELWLALKSCVNSDNVISGT